MQLKGIEKLREKLPDYPGNRIGFLPLRGIVAMSFGYLLLIVLDIAPRLFASISLLILVEPFIPIIGSFLLAGLSLNRIWQVWEKREEMINKYQSLAYQKMIPTGVVGVFLIPALLFHVVTSIRSLPPTTPVNDLSILWSQSIMTLIGIPIEIDIILRLCIAGIFLILGILTIRSALMTFGIDYMTVVYLYFPEESEIQEHEIYSVVRHPTYMAGVLIGLAALFFRFSVYSIILFFAVFLVFRLQIWKEEGELIERFGESYREYMDKTPALLVRPRDLKTFVKFITGRQ